MNAQAYSRSFWILRKHKYKPASVAGTSTPILTPRAILSLSDNLDESLGFDGVPDGEVGVLTHISIQWVLHFCYISWDTVLSPLLAKLISPLDLALSVPAVAVVGMTVRDVGPVTVVLRYCIQKTLEMDDAAEIWVELSWRVHTDDTDAITDARAVW